MRVMCWSSLAKRVQVISDSSTDKAIAEVVLSNATTLCFHTGNRVRIANATDSEKAFEKNEFLCGFYKGQWCKEGQDQHFDPTTDIKFEIQDADSEIVLPGQPLVVSRLGTEMDRRCETKPNSKICYHSMTEAPRADQPSYFTATTTSTVFWSAQSQMIKNEKIANPNHAAGLVPLQTWDSNATKIVFLSKWSHRGLMPVRPYVFVRENIILAPGTCVQLVPK